MGFAGYEDIPDFAGRLPECPMCGSEMGYSYIRSEFKCPDCGYLMDQDDWDYEAEEDVDEMNIPFGCIACGGPYPKCMSSCKMYDD